MYFHLNSRLFYLLLPYYYTVFIFYEKQTENHWLNLDSEGKNRNTNTLQNLTHFHHSTTICGGVLAVETVFCFETYFMLEATESASVPGDVVISECMTLQY